MGRKGRKYEAPDQGQKRNRGGNKNVQRAQKAVKQLGKIDGDSGDDAEANFDAPADDGGFSTWSVCGASAAISTSTAVISTTLHASVDTINTSFNGTNPDYARCYELMQQYEKSLRQQSAVDGGIVDPQIQGCLSKGNPGFYDCLKSLFAITPMNISQVPANYIDACGADFFGKNSSTPTPDPTAPTAQDLSAGNVFSASVSTDNDVGTRIEFIFVYVSLFCVLLGAMLSVCAGTRAIAMMGSLLVAAGFIASSFLDTDQEIAVTILTSGVAGVGTAFLRVAAIIAVLKYFEELRMRAIVLSGLGAVLINFLMIGLTFIDGINLDWRTTFKFQGIPAGVSFIASFFLKPLKRKSRRRSGRGSSCGDKCSSYIFSRDLFSDVVLYLVALVFFLDQIGRPRFSEGMQPIMEEKDFYQNQIDVQPFIENGGALLGLLMLLLWKRHNLADNLAVMAAMDVLIGLLAMHIPEMRSFVWVVVYSAIFGFTDGVFASVLQDAIPEGFRRRHIKMVAGILGFVAGAGTVASNWIGVVLDDKFDKMHVPFYFSGGCLILAGLLAIISRLVVCRRQTNDEPSATEMYNSQQRY